MVSDFKNIFILDDDRQLVEVLNEMLRILYEDSMFETSNDPQASSERLNSKGFDLIICDMLMPHKSGEEVIKELRAGDGPNKNTPVLVVTAKLEDAQEKLQGIERVVIINKPVTVSKLKENINKLI